jgi:hypothetical protein
MFRNVTLPVPSPQDRSSPVATPADGLTDATSNLGKGAAAVFVCPSALTTPNMVEQIVAATARCQVYFKVSLF